MMVTSLDYVEELFLSFLEDRRCEPKQDVLILRRIRRCKTGDATTVDLLNNFIEECLRRSI